MYLRALFLVLAAGSALADPVKPPNMTDAERTRLDKGEVVIHELKPVDGKGVAFDSLGVIDAPSPEVWAVLRDCSQFNKFMPRIKASAIKYESGEPLCAVELALPWPLTNLWSDTKSIYTEDDPPGHFSRVWTLVRGTYKRNDGSWTVVPWGKDNAKALVVYAVDSDPKMIIPDPIMRGAQTGALPDVFKSIRKRVLDLRAAAPKSDAGLAAQSGQSRDAGHE